MSQTATLLIVGLLAVAGTVLVMLLVGLYFVHRDLTRAIQGLEHSSLAPELGGELDEGVSENQAGPGRPLNRSGQAVSGIDPESPLFASLRVPAGAPGVDLVPPGGLFSRDCGLCATLRRWLLK